MSERPAAIQPTQNADLFAYLAMFDRLMNGVAGMVALPHPRSIGIRSHCVVWGALNNSL
jgi:hypothetical protein